MSIDDFVIVKLVIESVNKKLESMDIFDNWKQRAKQLKIETYVLYLAYKDPRTPWYAKIFSVCVVGYTFSPIDLIPDFIPVLGYLDDLILLPLGVIIAMKMIPKPVLEECRRKARERIEQGKPLNWFAGSVIILVWLLAFIILIGFGLQLVNTYLYQLMTLLLLFLPVG